MRQYRTVLESGKLDCLAITDHNRIDFATQAKAQLGDRIIVGEEIMTNQGEIIGLFLNEQVKPGLTPVDTVKAIKAQGGLVYIPHPFETVRKGLHPAILETIQEDIDIIEVCNGRAFLQNRGEQALVWAKLNQVVPAASSDAHGIRGLGKTYTSVQEIPTAKNLTTLLASGMLQTHRPGIRSLLYPKYHKIRNTLVRG